MYWRRAVNMGVVALVSIVQPAIRPASIQTNMGPSIPQCPAFRPPDKSDESRVSSAGVPDIGCSSAFIDMQAALGQQSALLTLRRWARPRVDQEHCQFCSLPLQALHRHLLELATRKIICACDACALRFDNVVGRWKLIPRDTRRLSDFRMTEADWASFSLPIELAFFFRSSPANKIVAMYPSPAGATESLLPLACWEALARANPALSEMEPDVQALLANRLKEKRDYYLAPIDTCFELVGLIRLHWRGFSGGDRVWQEIDGFFAKLQPNYLPTEVGCA